MLTPIDWIKGAAFAASKTLKLTGRPVPCPRPRVSRSGAVYYAKNYNEWRAGGIKQLAAQSASDEPFDAPVAVALEAIVERPKKTIRLLPGGDVDNFTKSVLDLLTKFRVWSDDDLVELLVVRKRWAAPGEEPGFNIMVGRMA